MFPILSQLAPRGKQREKLLEIGTYLQQVRTERDLPLETIARETSIPLRLLEAIEAGDLESLPEPVYIRWLIARFADHLSLEGEKISLGFPCPGRCSWKFPRLPRSIASVQIRPIHLYFLYLLLVIASVHTLSRVLEKSVLRSDRLPPPSLPTEPIVRAPGANPASPVADRETTNRHVVVEIEAKDDCWLKVIVDGQTQFEGLLTQGTQRVWQADKALTVRAGNAGGVYVAVNNESAKQLGQPGKAGEVTYRNDR